jgi:intron-binding protein aquarius
MLIGDHHQLPPVVKNRAFQKYGHLDQSLYARFVRLKTPTVDLNLQGRGRPSIAKLYNWRYKELGNLPNVLTEMKYKLSNPGMTHEYQWSNCEDHEGQGETSPNPYFYQNLGEAEYVVALFMYMRLIGYPAAKITILTPYNGQKALLKDVVRQRCAWNPLFGEPAKITTVDKYQGQQNDYILISLVRTKAVGHIRDVRRLVVAMSRSRYGLYVFGKLSVFENCFELAPVLNLFIQRPLDLCLEPHEDLESGGTTVGEDRVPSLRVTDLKQMWSVLQNQMQNQFKGLQTSQGAPASGGKKKEAVPGL